MLTLFAKISTESLPLTVENHDEIRILREMEARGWIKAKFAPRSKGRDIYGQEILALVTAITPLGIKYYTIYSTLGNKYAGYSQKYP